MLQTFYSTTAQVSFTLLGLWWVVVQFKFDAWADDHVRAAARPATSPCTSCSPAS